MKIKPARTYFSTLPTVMAWLIAITALYFISQQNYLIFHGLIELFSIIVAWSIFIVAWNSRDLIKNHLILFLGIAYLFVGALDLIHTLAYKGMNVFSGDSSNLATQLWISARFMESVSLLFAPFFIKRKINTTFTLFAYGLISALLLGLVFFWNIFPICYVEGIGLTPFKKASEYLICLILAGAIALFWKHRQTFDHTVLKLLMLAMAATILAELYFTFYTDVYGTCNMTGHFFKLVSFYLLYKAVLQISLSNPYRLLFKELNKNEKRLAEAQRVAKIGNWELNLQTGELYWSDESYRLFGYQPGEVVPKYELFLSHVHPDIRKHIDTAIKEAIQKAEPLDLEYKITPKGGGTKIVSSRIRPDKDPSDTLYGIHGTTQDVTEQTKNRSRLQTLCDISSMPDADTQRIYDMVLTGIVSMTDSKYGFFGFTDDDESILTVHSWSKEVMADCHVHDKSLIFPIEPSGMWGNAVRDRKPFVLNAYSADCPNKKGSPEGHVSLTRVLSVPVLSKNKVVAVAAVANKENDYSQDDITQLTGFLNSSWLLIEKQHRDDAIKKARDEWMDTFDSISDIVTIQGPDMKISRANKATFRLFDKSPKEVIGKYCYELFRGSLEPCPGCPVTETLQDTVCHQEIIRHETLGKTFHVASSPILDDNKDLQHVVHVAKDITEMKKMEEELFQSHKMEAIGTLAGGIAHDFNNMLAAIMGFTELAKRDILAGNKPLTDLDHVLKASTRAKELVKQILTFSRKGEHKSQPIEPYLIIKESLKLLRSSLPSSIKIHQNIDTNSGSTLAGPTKVQQVIVNLCTNALHAMENEKGTLKVGVARRELNANDVKGKPNVSPGPFIELTVSDTGQGMNKATTKRIFEPYFTTKGIEKGTGLGLSVVHGIIEDYGGMIKVESTPEKGTTFHVFFPATEKKAHETGEKKVAVPLPEGNEHILFVDDESTLVAMNKARFERLGYTVTGLTDSVKAFEIFRENPENFDLVITDQTMPNMPGSELITEIMKIRPDTPIILCTGYSSRISEEKARKLGVKHFTLKPVGISKLAGIVRDVLDEH